MTLSGAQAGSATTSGNSAQVLISAEGLTTVSYFARDEAGNSEVAHQLEVRIDKSAPEIAALTTSLSTAWIGVPVVVSFPAYDPGDGSGLAGSSPDVRVDTEGAAQTVSGTAEDRAGNVSTASTMLNVDLTPPDIVLESRLPAANAVGWNSTPVTVTWTCSDATSGVVALIDSVAVGSEGAAQSAVGTCRDRANQVTTSTLAGIHVDTTPLSATIGAPANGAVLLLNAQVAASYSCHDALSGLRSCSGPVASGSAVETSSAGLRPFTVDATDAADNATSTTHLYSVRYVFSGFRMPIAPMPARNVVNAGRTVPVKYVLRDANGALLTDVATFASLTSAATVCDGSTPGVLVEATDADGRTQIRWDAAAAQFVYNWQTDKAWAGTCRVLELALNDGARYTATFQFK